MATKAHTHPDIDLVILPRSTQLGMGFGVRRALPSRHRRMVGPFIFLDQMGPASFAAGSGLDVAPHPHIGLATLTYLTQGSLVHRDTLGTVQTITPGAVNLMTAGRGVTHSERTGPNERQQAHLLAGMQMWLALPAHLEDMAPTFAHTPAQKLVALRGDGLTLTVLLGAMEGAVSPVRAASDALCAHMVMAKGSRYALAPMHQDRALYVMTGDVALAGRDERYTEGDLIVLRSGSTPTVTTSAGAQWMLIGGEPLAEPRYVEWNFVSSDPERIAQAKRDWQAQTFPTILGESQPILWPAEPEVPIYP